MTLEMTLTSLNAVELRVKTVDDRLKRHVLYLCCLISSSKVLDLTGWQIHES